MAEYEIERVCPVCGKHFEVLYKDLWAYKKARAKGGYDFYCTWKCLREAETNKKPKPEPQKRENKERLQVLVELMAAVKDGRNAYDYLQGMGYADPKDTLRRLRTTAKKDAPEIYKWMEQNGLLDMRKEHSGKGVDKMSQNKLTREQKGKAVDIAIQGGDPLEYLKKCGAKNPTAAWWYIKKTLKEANPNKYLELTNALNHQEKKEPEKRQLAEVAEKLPPEAVAEVPEADPLAGFQVVNMGKPVAMSREEHKKAHQGSAAITVPVEYDGFKVSAITGEYGDYKIQDGLYFYFRSSAGMSLLRVGLANVKEVLDEIKRAAKVLGGGCLMEEYVVGFQVFGSKMAFVSEVMPGKDGDKVYIYGTNNRKKAMKFSFEEAEQIVKQSKIPDVTMMKA